MNLMQISRVIALVVSCRSVKEASIIDVEVILHNLHCGNWAGWMDPLRQQSGALVRPRPLIFAILRRTRRLGVVHLQSLA
jgi:hypothetical protein